MRRARSGARALLSGKRKKLVELLQADGRLSLTALGRALGISHVGVRKHLDKLLGSGLVRVSASISPRALGAQLLVFLCEAEHFRLTNMLEVLRRCPRVAFLATLVGPYNLMAILVAEHPGVAKAVSLGVCGLRRMEGIRRSELYLVQDVLYPEGLPIKVSAEKEADETPCGLHCGSCDFYTSGECPACPATRWYKGPL